MMKVKASPSRWLAIAAVLLCMQANAEENQWLGGEGTWIDPESWSAQIEPQDYHTVFIDAFGGQPGNVTFDAELSNNTIAGLLIGSQGSLTLISNLSVEGDVSSYGTLIGSRNAAYGATLSVGGNLLLDGQGTTTIDNFNRIYSPSMRIEAGHTIKGGGRIMSLDLQNNGIILATGSLLIEPFPNAATPPVHVNNGVIRITEGGRFSSSTSVQIDNRSGRFEIAGGRFTGNIYGGSVITQGGNTRLNGTLRDTTVQGQAQTDGLTLVGDVKNNGTLVLSSTLPNFSSHLYGNAGAVLSGNGVVVNEGSVAAQLSRMTFGSEQTFRGSAVFSEGLNNRGTLLIQGDEGLYGSAQYPNTLTNSGSIVVATGSRLSAPTIDNQGGRIELQSGAKLIAYINGGTVVGHASTPTGASFKDLTLQGRWDTASNSYVGVSGTIVHNAELNVGLGSSSTGKLTLEGDTTFAGNGQTTLFSLPNSHSEIINDGNYEEGNHTLTFGQGHVLTGSGIVNVKVVNQGLILASSEDFIQFNRGWTNDGTLRIQDGAVVNAGTIDNRNGFIGVADGGLLRSYGFDGPIHGGVIHGGGDRSAISGSFSDVTLSGTLSSRGNGILVSGTIHNEGRLILGNLHNGGNGMTVVGQATLSGSGVTEMRNEANRFDTIARGEFGAGAVLTVASDHRVIALGLISDLALKNHGHMEINTGDLTLSRSVLENKGHLTVGNAFTLKSIESIESRGRDASIVANGVIEAPLLTLFEGAGLTGNGIIKGDVVSQAGQIVVDTGGVALSFLGDLTLDDASSLQIQGIGLLANPSVLMVDGDVNLGGTLMLSFDSQVKLGDTFDILVSNGLLTGVFSEFRVLGTDLPVTINYTANGVTASLIAAVPESSTFIQLAFGLLLIGAARGRRYKASFHSRPCPQG